MGKGYFIDGGSAAKGFSPTASKGQVEA